MALRISGATGIVSNPPHDRRLNPAIVDAVLTLLRKGKISMMMLMHQLQHGLASDVGYCETMDPLYTITIGCTWRTRLFTPQPETTNPCTRAARVERTRPGGPGLSIGSDRSTYRRPALGYDRGGTVPPDDGRLVAAN